MNKHNERTNAMRIDEYIIGDYKIIINERKGVSIRNPSDKMTPKLLGKWNDAHQCTGVRMVLPIVNTIELDEHDAFLDKQIQANQTAKQIEQFLKEKRVIQVGLIPLK